MIKLSKYVHIRRIKRKKIKEGRKRKKKKGKLELF